MKVPLSWLKERINLTILDGQIPKLLTNAGLEVEGVEKITPQYSGIVVGKILKVEKHPEADKLVLATVSDGSQNYQVVCGAPNCREGIKTAFAPPGASLQEESGKKFTIKIAKLRGVESHGMLCSEKELDISDDHDGIIEFDEHLKEGTDVADLYAETIYDISLTPNLGHCASIVGVARELGALIEEKVKYPDSSVTENDDAIERLASVEIKSKDKCPRYACRLIRDIKVGPSPHWLKKRLQDSGQRPVNNIVDITNFVLLELGHPLHAFDFDLLDDHKILVKQAADGEKFVTLDEKERTLCEQDLLICDGKKTVAIAGVMGGLNSEVNDKTKTVLLESAYFDPVSVRKTSKRLGIQTEASKRYERGADPNAVLKSLDRAAKLIAEIAGGKVSQGIIDVKDHEFEQKLVTCRFSRINKILGTTLSVSEVEKIFQNLNMDYSFDGDDTFTVTVPTFRVDITEEVDLVEEVGRIYGFDNIPRIASPYRSSSVGHSPVFLFENKIRQMLVSERLQEFLTCDLIGPSLLGIVKETVMSKEMHVEVMNPTSVEQSVLRTSLLPGLLQVVKYNFDHQVRDVSGFEVGRIHFKNDDKYKEQSAAAIILSGNAAPHHWDKKSSEIDFYDLKGVVENLLKELGIEEIAFKENALKIFHPGRQAVVTIDGHEIGSMGEVHPSIIRRLDLPQRVYFAEFDLQELYKLRKDDKKMSALAIYPASERDWTVTLSDTIPVQSIFDDIKELSTDLLEQVMLLDVYHSDKLGQGLKNVTFRFIYRDKTQTVENEVVENEHSRLIEQVEARLRR